MASSNLESILGDLHKEYDKACADWRKAEKALLTSEYESRTKDATDVLIEQHRWRLKEKKLELFNKAKARLTERDIPSPDPPKEFAMMAFAACLERNHAAEQEMREEVTDWWAARGLHLAKAIGEGKSTASGGKGKASGLVEPGSAGSRGGGRQHEAFSDTHHNLPMRAVQKEDAKDKVRLRDIERIARDKVGEIGLEVGEESPLDVLDRSFVAMVMKDRSVRYRKREEEDDDEEKDDGDEE